MWHRVEVVLTDVSEERIASAFNVSDGRFACGFSYFPLYPEDGGPMCVAITGTLEETGKGRKFCFYNEINLPTDHISFGLMKLGSY
jgi:hypothetical protein